MLAYKAVCLLGVAKPSADLWSKLTDYVSGGGGLAVIPGEELEHDSYNNKSTRGILPAGLDRIIRLSDAGGRRLEPVIEEGASTSRYPLVAKLEELRKKNVDFAHKEQWPLAWRCWNAEPLPDTSLLMTYADEKLQPDKKLQPALMERTLGQGHVLLFTTALDGRRLTSGKPWNNYWEESSFGFVLANLAMRYLTGDTKQADWNHLTGERVSVPVPPGPFSPLFKLQGPGIPGNETTVPCSKDQHHLVITQATVPGNYLILNDKDEMVAGFSLNVPAEECLLKRVPVKEIEDILGAGTVRTPQDDLRVRDAVEGDRPVELLPWLMLSLLLVLTAEALLANRFYQKKGSG